MQDAGCIPSTCVQHGSRNILYNKYTVLVPNVFHSSLHDVIETIPVPSPQVKKSTMQKIIMIGHLSFIHQFSDAYIGHRLYASRSLRHYVTTGTLVQCIDHIPGSATSRTSYLVISATCTTLYYMYELYKLYRWYRNGNTYMQ